MGKQYITGFGQISNLGLSGDQALDRLLSPNDQLILRLPKNHLESQDVRPHSLKIEDLAAVEDPPDYQLHRDNKVLLLCVLEALDEAKMDREWLKTQRVGVCIGSTSANLSCSLEFAYSYHRQDAESFQPMNDSLLNNPSSTLSRYFSLNGPVTSINNACTSGTDAIGIGASWIQQDFCDIVIAGGIDCIVNNMYLGFRSLGLVAPEYAKPFDAHREGLTLGEAAGVTILENPKSMRARDASPLCEVLGYGISTDSYHPTSPHPEARGLSLAVDQALKLARLSKKNVDLINAHGTGTPTNDLVEGNYLKENFPEAPVFATKAYTGHSLGAAGALEAIWGLLAMKHRFIPATLGHSQVDPEIGLIPNARVRDHKSDVFLSTSLGFGGANAALLLGSCP